MSIKDDYISVGKFALLTGLSPGEIEGRFTVEVDGRPLVPRFMAVGQQFGEIAHIELPPEQEEAAAESDYIPLAAVELNPGRLHSGKLSVQELDALPTVLIEPFESPAVSANETHQDGSGADTASAQATAHRRRRSRSQLTLQANPYRRLSARATDLIWETYLVLASALWLMTLFNQSRTLDLFQSPWSLAVLAIVLAPVTLLLDAATYALAGNTPGKFMLGLKVVSRHMRKLSFRRYALRNFRLWHRGLAYGVLPLTLFYLAREGVRVARGLETDYDQQGRTRVGQLAGSERLSVRSFMRMLGVVSLIIVATLLVHRLATKDRSAAANTGAGSASTAVEHDSGAGAEPPDSIEILLPPTVRTVDTGD